MVVGWLTLFAWIVPLSFWTDSLKDQLGVHVCSFYPGVFSMRKHLFSDLSFCFIATLQPMKWSSGLFICLRKAVFPFLSSWLPSSTRVIQGNHMISFHLSVQELDKNIKSKLIGLYLPETGYVIFWVLGNIIRTLSLKWINPISICEYLLCARKCPKHSVKRRDTHFCPLGVFSLTGNTNM